jgi:hypothetical protein
VKVQHAAVEEMLSLRVTPLVFAAMFGLGVWADPVDLFGFWPGWATTVSFTVSMFTMIGAAVVARDSVRFVALAFGSWSALSRGLTLLVAGQEGVPRKTEIIGGGVWLTASYLVMFTWVMTVPVVGLRERDR